MSKNISFVQGNEACALGAMYAGLDFYAGYPITPSTEIAETLALIGMRGIVKKSSVEKVLADKFPPSFHAGNQMALDIGFEMGFEYAG